MSDHLAQNPTFDLSVAGERVLPPPAAPLHRFGGGNKAVGDCLEISFCIIEAEDQPTGANPAQRQAFRPQIVLEHPVVGGRPRITNRPDRRQIRYLYRQPGMAQALIERHGAAIPNFVEVAIERADRRFFKAPQEFVHCRHDIRVRVERATRKADIGRSILAETFHQALLSANGADRQAAAESLAIGDEVGPNVEIILRAAEREAEADEDLIEDQYDAALGAYRPELLQPIGKGHAIET